MGRHNTQPSGGGPFWLILISLVIIALAAAYVYASR